MHMLPIQDGSAALCTFSDTGPAHCQVLERGDGQAGWQALRIAGKASYVSLRSRNEAWQAMCR